MEYKIERSARKTIGIRVNPDLSVTVKAPYFLANREIERVMREKENWIIKTADKIKAAQEALKNEEINYLTNEELEKLADEALAVIPGRVKYFSEMMGVSYGRITIRNQKTRWGSCSSKGNLNFNCLIMLAPSEVIDYLVVHELCHRKQMNHSKAFWSEVEKILPDYRQSVSWLKKEGSSLMHRMRR